MEKFKKLFKLYDKSLMGHLNYIGVILFAIITIVFLMFFSSNLSIKNINIYIYLALFSIATSNINRAVLPYKKQKPALLFTSKKLALRHLYFTIRRVYFLQLVMLSLVILTILFNNQYHVMTLIAILTILNYYLSFLAYGIFNIFLRILILVQLILLIFDQPYLMFINILIQLLLIYICLKISSKINSMFGIDLLLHNKKHNSKNLLTLCLTYFKNNIILIFFIGFAISLSMYFVQMLFSSLTTSTLPGLALVFINWIIILEILIGQSKEEIMFDRSRIEMLVANSNVSQFKRFQSSTIYGLMILIIFMSFFGLLGTLTYSFDISLLIKNVLSFPLIILISFVYYRKKELLIIGFEHKLLKFSLLILIVLVITIYSGLS